MRDLQERGVVAALSRDWSRPRLQLIIAGTAVQFAQPWAGVLGVVNLVLLYARSVYEERVLVRTYPEYVAYRTKTARFVPGVF